MFCRDMFTATDRDLWRWRDFDVEDTRRYNTRPEPGARDDTHLPLVEVPRALIELSKEQWEEAGPEPPRAPTDDVTAHQIWREVDE